MDSIISPSSYQKRIKEKKTPLHMSLIFRFLTCFLIFFFNFLFINSGIGYALAKEFLQTGDNVIICSRSGKDLHCMLILDSLPDI